MSGTIREVIENMAYVARTLGGVSAEEAVKNLRRNTSSLRVTPDEVASVQAAVDDVDRDSRPYVMEGLEAAVTMERPFVLSPRNAKHLLMLYRAAVADLHAAQAALAREIGGKE